MSLIPLFLQKRNLFFILCSFIFGYYFVIGPIVGSSSLKEHYIVAIVPFMAIVSAYGIYYFYKNFFEEKANFVKNIFSGGIKIFAFVAIFLYPVYLAILWDYRVIQPSTQVLAQEWIHNHLPQGARIANFDTAISINETRRSIEDVSMYASDFLLRKQAYLLSIDDDKYPKPN